ncbi:hypothetical protein [Anaerosphaera multitolerans]|uniref:Uncharacterized protein n=1 Tax=Anaerosphaera multitolerans TaxID=2487351 RepID=A0A437S643_9FIRM|nr:hypothetical protein [Anaerosphaera multitolerans]RVU54480.1 hypothetical protein EF514_06915 [Anaerosphaera multitolerans]
MSNLVPIKKHIKEILKDIEDIEKDLNSAKNWGIFDIFKGKGLTSLMKHSRISDAERKFNKLKKELNILSEELEKANIYYDFEFKNSSINTFLDIFVDNIFSDFYSQSNINVNREKIKRLKTSLETLYEKF